MTPNSPKKRIFRPKFCIFDENFSMPPPTTTPLYRTVKFVYLQLLYWEKNQPENCDMASPRKPGVLTSHDRDIADIKHDWQHQYSNGKSNKDVATLCADMHAAVIHCA